MTKDVLIISLSDTHSGSIHALYPDRLLQLKSLMPIGANEYQKQMYAHFMDCAKYVKAHRKNRDLIMVHNGDAIEGIHHDSVDHISPKWDDHVTIHQELMDDFRRAAGITASDKTYYVSGTESHTKDLEESIASYYDAEPAAVVGDKVLRLHHELKINVNGREIWYTHHGARPGAGANEGNAIRNWLRDRYWEMKREGRRPPDVIYMSHYHKTVYNTYVDDYHVIHGVVLPSWQIKTRFALRTSPFQRNDIGMTFAEITSSGDIRIHKPLLLRLT